MKQATITLLLIASTLCPLAAQTFKQIWEVSGLESPESALYDPVSRAYYVSNISGGLAEKDGNGFIAKINEEGAVTNLRWATGLNAPKGLGLYNNTLYVADIDEVVAINIKSGEVVKRYSAEGASFLNDIEVSEDGAVYITNTFGGSAIYQIKDDTISLWLKSDALNFPNGLKIRGGKLYVASWGVVTDPQTFATQVPGKIISVSLNKKKIKDITGPLGNFDGLIVNGNGFIVSDWMAGTLVSINQKGEMSTLKNLSKGLADVSIVEGKNLLLAPMLLDNKLVVYSITN